MAIMTNKQRLLTQLFTVLKKRLPGAEPAARPVLEQFVYALCREGATRQQADQAFEQLQAHFFDWNEVRVSSVREVEEVLGDLPGAESRAQRLVSFLQEVFETEFSFDLEALHKRGLKQAARQLSKYQAANDFAAAWVIQHSLGGHAIPVDGPTLRVLHRLGILDEGQEDLESLRASLEHLIPKAKGTQFADLISAVAAEYCWESDPNCPACPLARDCPSAQLTTASGGSLSAKVSRSKPR